MENLLPDLTPEEYRRLKESIDIHGVLVPVSICAHTGRILDGNHRVRACNELGKDYPRALVSLPDEDARRAYARSINLIRRTLTTQQRKDIICTHIKEFFTKSDRQLGIEMGVDHKTIGKYRKELTVGGEIPQVVVNEGADGKIYTRKPVTVFAPNERQARALKKPGVAERMIEDGMTSAKNALARIHREEKSERKDPTAYKITEKDVRLIHADIRTGIPQIKDESIHLCLTDAPYAKSYTSVVDEGDVYEPLSALCNRVLVDGGSLLCMTGLYYLPNVLASLGTHLTYNWIITVLLKKASSKTFDRYAAAHHKPICWHVKGKLAGGDWYEDVYRSEYDPEDRALHPHGQSLELFTELAYRHSDSQPIPHTILDPFVGGGTTALAAISQGRRFIGCDISMEHLQTTQRRIKQAFDLDIPIE